MPPKASAQAKANNANSTVKTNGRPKRKRTRNRRRRVAASLSSDSSSSDDDDSSEDEDEAPKASTSALPKATSQTTAKSKDGSESSEESDEGEDEDSSAEESDSSAASSSSSSSFLSSSSASSSVAARGKRKANQQQQHAQYSNLDGQNGYDYMNEDQNEALSAQRVSTRPERQASPTREASPPFIQFGPDADIISNTKAFGKPILWGLLPSDLEEAAPKDPEVQKELERAQSKYMEFREHYVSRLIERYGESLDEVRKKEGSDLKESRLKVLIASIANGADTFTTNTSVTGNSVTGSGPPNAGSAGDIWRVGKGKKGEREVALEALELFRPQGGADDAGSRVAPSSAEEGDVEMS